MKVLFVTLSLVAFLGQIPTARAEGSPTTSPSSRAPSSTRVEIMSCLGADVALQAATWPVTYVMNIVSYGVYSAAHAVIFTSVCVGMAKLIQKDVANQKSRAEILKDLESEKAKLIQAGKLPPDVDIVIEEKPID